MTSTAQAAARPAAATRSARLPFRLPRAELLKLRRRRGLVAIAGLLTVGATAIVYLAFELYHVSSSAKYGPAGGFDHFRHAAFVLSQLGAVAAALVGASAGADDIASGVFRDLVATGRSRTSLFLARIPGGLALVFAFVAVAYALAAVLGVALAGSDPTPSTTVLAETGLWTLLVTGLAFGLGLGLGSLLGSRAATIAVLFAWIMVLEPILIHVGALGRGRDVLLSAGLNELAPSGVLDRDNQVAMSTGVGVLVVVAWLAAPLGLGLWRMRTRDA